MIFGCIHPAAHREEVDALLEKQKARTAAFRKISESTALWALLIVLGFIAKALWDSAMAAVKTRIP